MRFIVALLVLSVAASAANAQAGRDTRGDDARSDALLGTPNRATPVPQTNLFSTSPGLTQQAPGPSTKDSPKVPNAPTAGAKP